MSTTAVAPTSSADGVTWDLSVLYDNPDDPKLAADLDAVTERAAAFEKRYRGQVAGLDAAGPARRRGGAAGHPRGHGPPGHLRPPAARRPDRRADPRPVGSPHPGTQHRHQPAPDLLRPGVDRGGRRAGRGTAGRPDPQGLRLPAAPGAPLQAPPAIRGRRAAVGRKGQHRQPRLEPPIRGTHQPPDLRGHRGRRDPHAHRGGNPGPELPPRPRNPEVRGRTA